MLEVNVANRNDGLVKIQAADFIKNKNVFVWRVICL